MTITTDAERRRQDNLNTASLVGLLGLMAFTTSGGVIYALALQLDGQLEALIAFSGLLLAAGLIGLIIYVLVNPVHDRPSRPPTYAVSATSQRSDEYSTLAIAAFVLAFVFSLVGIVLGHLALRDVRRTGKRGHGLALAALIISYTAVALGLILWVLLIVLIRSS